MLEVSHLRKSYGSDEARVDAIGDLSLEVAAGEFACIVGPSGCGKTTMLKCIGGLQPSDGGTVAVAGRRVQDGPAPELAIVFQDYSRSLFPWMTVRGNVTFPLEYKQLTRTARDRLAVEAIASVGLAGFEDRYPWQLSGGMQQRAAIARALAYEPKLLLMDEPFASVDAQTRADLEDLMLRIHERTGVTVLFITHDIDEAVYLSDVVYVLGPRPTRTAEVVRIDLPRPREQVATKELADYAHLRAGIYSRIKREVSGVA